MKWITASVATLTIIIFIGSFNEVAHVKMKLINIQTEEVIWSGDGYDTSWTMKSAILNATKQVLKTS